MSLCRYALRVFIPSGRIALSPYRLIVLSSYRHIILTYLAKAKVHICPKPARERNNYTENNLSLHIDFQRAMKRLCFLLPLLLLALLLMPIPLNCQEKQKQEKKQKEKDLLSVEFNMNYSMVLGSYGQTDKETDKSGYAKNGWVAALTLNWLGKNGLGLGFQYDLQHNGYKDTAATTIPNGTKYPLGTSGWYNNYLLAGPVFIRDFGKVELNVKALLGVIVATSSNFNIESPVDKTNVSVTATGFGYAVNVGVGYRIDKHWGVNLQLGYLGGTPKATKTYGSEFLGYRQVKDTLTGDSVSLPYYSAATKYEIKRIVSTFNGGVGVIYHF